MNYFHLFVFAAASAAVMACSSCFAEDAKNTGSVPDGWLTDYGKAVSLAKKENSPILALFTGSDWCIYCMKLHENVLSTPAFQQFAKQHLVLLYLDFPRGITLSPELKKQNADLQKKFSVSGFPTTLILAPDGTKKIGSISGYSPEYMSTLETILAEALARDFAAHTARYQAAPPEQKESILHEIREFCVNNGMYRELAKFAKECADSEESLYARIAAANWLQDFETQYDAAKKLLKLQADKAKTGLSKVDRHVAAWAAEAARKLKKDSKEVESYLSSYFSPEDPDGYILTQMAVFQLESPDGKNAGQAVVYAEQASELLPGSWEPVFVLAQAKRKQGRLEEAKTAILRAYDLAKDHMSADVPDLAGDIMSELGDHAAARKYWSEAHAIAKARGLTGLAASLEKKLKSIPTAKPPRKQE